MHGPGQRPPALPGDGPTNVLLITVDSLRADHLGCYGYHRPTSPQIDQLAAQGAVVERFFCAGIPTQPSYTTLYTGQHPINHGIVAHGGKALLPREAPFLPQLLVSQGYVTAAFDNLVRIKPWFGRGYEYYVDSSIRRPLLLGVTCEEINHRLVPWLRSHADEQFFAFVHYWDPHFPFVAPQKYRHLFYRGDPTDPSDHSLDRWWDHPMGALARDTWLRRPRGHVTDARYVEALYDQEVRHLDDGVGAVLAALDEAGLADDTLVILLADHGESMTEHGIYFDHHGLYETTIHSPLIVRWPGGVPAGLRLAGMRQHHDVAPTILEALGLEVPPEMDGESFWATLRGEAPDAGRERVYACESTWQAKWCVRTPTHKLILSREPDRYGKPLRELFDVVADPQEERNLVDELPELVAALEAELEGWIAEQLAATGKTEDPVREQGISIRGV